MPDQPNIIVFMTDDHGQWASNPYGCREMHTPSLNYLANHGVRFANAFTPSPVCSPARASFWTGKIPSHHGLHDYLQETPNFSMDHPGIGDQRTLAQRLQQAGYRTGFCGKWHAGGAGQPQKGFDDWFASSFGTNARFAPQCFNHNGQEVRWHGHRAPRVTDQAIRFLRQSQTDQPLFLFVGHTNTHIPHRGEPERWVDHYRNARFDDIPDRQYGGEHGATDNSMRRSDPKEREGLAQYYAAVSHIDEQVGRVLDELESQGRIDNTLVIYTSDHGHMNGHHGLHCKANATVPQNMLEESIRVPHLAMWGDRVGEGVVSDARVDHHDLHATLCDVAGCEPDEMCPGRSYLPLVGASRSAASSPEPGEDIYWRQTQFCEYGNCRMVRNDRFKLIRRYPGPNGHFPDEFYDLQRDPEENVNVIDDSSYANTVSELDLQLNAYFEQYENPRVSGTRIGAQPRTSEKQVWYIDPRDLAV